MDYLTFQTFLNNIQIDTTFKNILITNSKSIYILLFEKIINKIDTIELYSLMKIFTKYIYSLNNSMDLNDIVNNSIVFIVSLIGEIDIQNKEEIIILLENSNNLIIFCIYYLKELEKKINCNCFYNFSLKKDLNELYEKNLIKK